MLLYGLYAIESRKCDIQQTEIIMDTCKMRNKSFSISVPNSNLGKAANICNRQFSAVPQNTDAKILNADSNTKHKSDHSLHTASFVEPVINTKSGRKSIVNLNASGRSLSHAQLIGHSKENSNMGASLQFQKNLMQFEDYIRKLKDSSPPTSVIKLRQNNGSAISNSKIYKSLKNNRASIVNQNKHKSLNKIEFLTPRQRRNTCSDASLLLIHKDDLVVSNTPIILNENIKRKQSCFKSLKSSSDSSVKPGHFFNSKSKTASSSFSKRILQKQLNSLGLSDARINRLAMDLSSPSNWTTQSVRLTGAYEKATRKMSLAAHHYQSIYSYNASLPSPLIEQSSSSSQALEEKEAASPQSQQLEITIPKEPQRLEKVELNQVDILYEKKRLQSMCDDLNKIKLHAITDSGKTDNLKAYLAKNRKSKSWLSTIFTKFKRSNSTS